MVASAMNVWHCTFVNDDVKAVDWEHVHAHDIGNENCSFVCREGQGGALFDTNSTRCSLTLHSFHVFVPLLHVANDNSTKVKIGDIDVAILVAGNGTWATTPCQRHA